MKGRFFVAYKGQDLSIKKIIRTVKQEINKNDGLNIIKQDDVVMIVGNRGYEHYDLIKKDKNFGLFITDSYSTYTENSKAIQYLKSKFYDLDLGDKKINGVFFIKEINDLLTFVSTCKYDFYYAKTKKNKELVISDKREILDKLCGFCEYKNLYSTLNPVFINGNAYDTEGIIGERQNDDIINLNKVFSKNNLDDNKQSQCYSSESKQREDTQLEKYGSIMNNKNYPFDPAIGRSNDVRELQKKLIIPKKGVILVGKPGVGKTAIVEGLAYKIKNGEVCDRLKDVNILSVEVSNIVSGCKYVGTLEKKVSELIENISKSSRETILFLDEIHTALGAGTGEKSNIDIASILKPYISNDKIKIIGTTTNDEYNYFLEDKAFKRRFNAINVDEVSYDVICNILLTNIYNNPFNIDISVSDDDMKELLHLIIKLSKRRGKNQYEVLCNLDSSINILMDIFSYMVISNIKTARINDFIDGIKDSSSIKLSDIEKRSFFTNFYNQDEDNNKSKIITLSK